MSLHQDFKRDGFLTAIDAIPADRAGYYAEKCSSFIETWCAHPDFSHWTYGKTELLLQWVAELAAEKTLLDVIEQLIGPDLLLWNAFLPVKPPKSKANFGWHQDATYWPLTPTDQIVSAWVALSPANQFSGGMQMVRESHLLGAVPHEAVIPPFITASRSRHCG